MMPSIGDTRISIVFYTANPADEETDVSVNLAEMTFLLRVEEYLNVPPLGWYSGAFVAIVSASGMSLTESPGINEGSLIFEVGVPNYIGTITVPINAALSGNTEYTWEIDISLTHGTLTFGEVTRNYTTLQISFTTEAIRQINLSSPANTATGVVLQPLLQWSIDGGGAEAGDLLDVYLRKNDSNFGADDQLGFLVDAILNSSWQIVGGLDYDSTYYWQIQAAASGDDELLSSAIWSFTTSPFYPPAYSTRERLVYGEPGGPGDPEGDPGDPDVRNYETVPSGENNMLTVRRLIVAARNRIYYEDF